MLRNILSDMGYEIHQIKKVGFDKKRVLTKNAKKGWLILEVDESEVEGIIDMDYKSREYALQIKSQINNKHYNTLVEVKKYF